MTALRKMAKSLGQVALACGCASMFVASTGCMVGDQAGGDQSTADLSVEARDCGNHGGFFAQTQVRDALTGAVIPGSEAMLGVKNGWAWARLETTIDPNEAVTLWLVGFNHPENCSHPDEGPLQIRTAHCGALDAGTSGAFGNRVDGAVGGSDGSVELQGLYNPTADNIPFVPDPSWDGSPNAEFSLVVRTHGQASSDPDILNDQLTLFNGGNCPDKGAPATGDCHDKQYGHLY